MSAFSRLLTPSFLLPSDYYGRLDVIKIEGTRLIVSSFLLLNLRRLVSFFPFFEDAVRYFLFFKEHFLSPLVQHFICDSLLPSLCCFFTTYSHLTSLLGPVALLYRWALFSIRANKRFFHSPIGLFPSALLLSIWTIFFLLFSQKKNWKLFHPPCIFPFNGLPSLPNLYFKVPLSFYRDVPLSAPKSLSSFLSPLFPLSLLLV